MGSKGLSFVILLALACCASFVWSGGEKAASPLPPSIQGLDWIVQDQGNLHCNITNFGLIGSIPGSGAPFENQPSGEWPAFSGVEYIWSSGLWVGAIKNGAPVVSTTSYALEFRPGNGFFDVMYETKENATGGKRLPSPNADDDGDGKTDEDPLDGHDNDNDQKADEDFAAISDQMLTARFNDMDPDILNFIPDHVPLGLEIVQNTMAWLPKLNENLIGFDYKIINAGVDTLTDAYVGFFADFDIGRHARGAVSLDDRSGFWEGLVTPATDPAKEIPVSVGYMLDADGDNGESEGSIGIVFLHVDDPHGPQQRALKLRNYRTFTGDLFFDFGGDPANHIEQYKALNGEAPFSLLSPDPNTDRTPSSTASGDYRNLVSVGPFDLLAPGDTLCVSMAIIIGNGFDGMLQTAAQAQILYDGLWFDCDQDPQTGIDGRECNAPWMSDVPTPVELQQLSANLEGQHVLLNWQFAPEALTEIRAVSIQRAATPEGPFHSIERNLLPTSRMSFLDAETQSGRTYWYRLMVTATDGTDEPTRAVSIQAQDQGFARTELLVNMPTPSSPVEMRYRIAQGSNNVSLAIYDINGRLVRSIDKTQHNPGEYLRTWDRRDHSGASVSRGIYLVNLHTSNVNLSRKVVLLH